MSLGFSAFDAQQAPALSNDKRLYSTDTSACSLFLKLPTVKKTTKRLTGGSTFYLTPINAVEFLKQVWPSSLMMSHNFADFSFVLRCATLCNDVL